MSEFRQLHRRKDTPGVFVVHGIGKQRWAETAALLYGNFEDALKVIETWQADNLEEGQRVPINRPPVREAFWADYDDPEKFLGTDWEALSEYERAFYRELWNQRVVSAADTYKWFVKQIFRLWNPARVVKMMSAGSLIAWPLYLLLAPFALVTLTLVRWRRQAILSDFLNDIRLYVEPRGSVQAGIVKQIDILVEREMMQLIGLRPDFTIMNEEEWITDHGERVCFDRLIVVAHSLGSVITYNVLVDLIERALEVEQTGSEEQKKGVTLFRDRLARFVTLGSPLDKIAILFGEPSVRRWPDVARETFFRNWDNVTTMHFWKDKDWWINFYHVLDPISGSLEAELICRQDPPTSFHARSGLVPGMAHSTYWHDSATLRFILSRAFGPDRLPDRPLTPWPIWFLSLLSGGSYVLWTLLVLVALATMVAWAWEFIQSTWASWLGMIGR